MSREIGLETESRMEFICNKVWLGKSFMKWIDTAQARVHAILALTLTLILFPQAMVHGILALEQMSALTRRRGFRIWLSYYDHQCEKGHLKVEIRLA